MLFEAGATEGRPNLGISARERRETGEQDLFRPRLDRIIDLKHSACEAGAGDRAIDWHFLEKFGAVYPDKPGHPPLPTSADGDLCGEEFLWQVPPCRSSFDRSSLTRWRQRMGKGTSGAAAREPTPLTPCSPSPATTSAASDG